MEIGDYVYYIGEERKTINHDTIYLILIIPLTSFDDILNIGLVNNNRKIEFVDKKDVVNEIEYRRLKINKIKNLSLNYDNK